MGLPWKVFLALHRGFFSNQHCIGFIKQILTMSFVNSSLFDIFLSSFDLHLRDCRGHNPSVCFPSTAEVQTSRVLSFLLGCTRHGNGLHHLQAATRHSHSMPGIGILMMQRGIELVIPFQRRLCCTFILISSFLVSSF